MPQEARTLLRTITQECQLLPRRQLYSSVMIGNMISIAYASASNWRFIGEHRILRSINVGPTSTSQARRSSLVRPSIMLNNAVVKTDFEDVVNKRSCGNVRDPFCNNTDFVEPAGVSRSFESGVGENPKTDSFWIRGQCDMQLRIAATLSMQTSESACKLLKWLIENVWTLGELHSARTLSWANGVHMSTIHIRD